MTLKRTHLLLIAVAFGAVVLLWVVGLSAYYVFRPSRPSAAQSRSFGMNSQVDVGYMRYIVHEAKFVTELSNNQFIKDSPNANFLVVDLWVQNTDREERTIPPFKLIDETGAEYGTSDKSWAMDNAIGLLEALNPSVSKRGLILFDVPSGHSYKLKVSGGYWSNSDAVIDLTLTTNR
jgi:hypothetical protein